MKLWQLQPGTAQQCLGTYRMYTTTAHIQPWKGDISVQLLLGTQRKSFGLRSLFHHNPPAAQLVPAVCHPHKPLPPDPSGQQGEMQELMLNIFVCKEELQVSALLIITGLRIKPKTSK